MNGVQEWRHGLTADELNSISEGVIGAAIAVHRELGPGLLESAYEACLVFELMDRGYRVVDQLELPVFYRGQSIDAGFKIDLLVNEAVIVELKAVDRMIPVYDAQLLTYLKLTQLNLGLLMNFNTVKVIDGVKRIARAFPEP